MLIIIDRFEGDFAVVETEQGGIYNIPKALIPNTKEGDAVRIVIDDQETQKRKNDINSLMDELFKD